MKTTTELRDMVRVCPAYVARLSRASRGWCLAFDLNGTSYRVALARGNQKVYRHIESAFNDIESITGKAVGELFSPGTVQVSAQPDAEALYYAEYFSGDVLLSRHSFTLECPSIPQASTYRAGRSYDSIANRFTPSSVRRVLVYTAREWKRHVEFERRSHDANGTQYPELPRDTYVHESIWDFYNSVGYDHKRRRFNPA